METGFLGVLALPIGEKGVHAGGWKVTNAKLHKFDERRSINNLSNDMDVETILFSRGRPE